MKELKENALEELLTGSDTENVDSALEWLICDTINVEDKVESWPLKSAPDEAVRKLGGNDDTGKKLGNIGESKSTDCWAWLLFWLIQISQHPSPHPGQSTPFSAPYLSHSILQA